MCSFPNEVFISLLSLSTGNERWKERKVTITVQKLRKPELEPLSLWKQQQRKKIIFIRTRYDTLLAASRAPMNWNFHSNLPKWFPFLVTASAQPQPRRSVLVSVLQKNRTSRIYIEIYEEIYYRNWLMWLWKPRSAMACHLQAGEPGKPVVKFSLHVRV